MGVKISELPAATALTGTESFPVVQAGETRKATVTDALLGTQRLHGFPLPYAVILSYSAANRQITLTPTGATFDIWLSGVKVTKIGAQISPAHANTTGDYFIYYDADGALQASDTAWAINSAVIPVCYVYYNATLVDGIALFELHSAGRNLEWHESQHFALGTFVRSGLEISGYTLNTDTSAAVTFAIASGMIVDEDIEYTISAIADNGPYTILNRSGAVWTWTTNNVLPYRYSVGAYINYNWDNAGSWSLADVSNGNWVNYYLFATTAIDTNKQLLLIPGQVQHASLSSAQAESVSSLSFSDLAIPELAAVWKLTFRAGSAYNGVNGKARLVEVNRLTQSKAQLSGNFNIGSHNSLNGRDAAESHPASAIINIPAGNIVAVTVQAAIDELDSEKAATGHTHTGTYEPALGNPGTNGYVLSSTTGGTRSWVSGGGSPGLVLLATASASDVAYVDFTGIDNTYDEYEVHIQNAIPATDAADIYSRTSTNNGSSFDDGASDYSWLMYESTLVATPTASGSNSGDNADSWVRLTRNGVGNDTNKYGYTGIIKLCSPYNTTRYKTILHSGAYQGSIHVLNTVFGAGQRLATADIDAIRFLFSTGNISSGEFKLYGIKKSL